MKVLDMNITDSVLRNNFKIVMEILKLTIDQLEDLRADHEELKATVSSHINP